jgi:hypothetical protein
MPEEPKRHSQKSNENDIITYFEWSAPGRPFRKRTKQFYLTALLIMLLFEVILFLFSQYLLMVVVLALVFVAFVLNTVPPRDFHYRISSQGFMLEDRFFLWQELYDFYFKDVNGVETLRLRTQDFFPGEIIVTLDHKDREYIKKVLISFLPFREFVKPTFVDKAADWLARNFPLDR